MPLSVISKSPERDLCAPLSGAHKLFLDFLTEFDVPK